MDNQLLEKYYSKVHHLLSIIIGEGTRHAATKAIIELFGKEIELKDREIKRLGLEKELRDLYLQHGVFAMTNRILEIESQLKELASLSITDKQNSNG